MKDYLKKYGLYVIAGFIALVAIAALAGGAFGTERAEAPAPACSTIEQVVKKLADENQGVQPVKSLEGKAAADLAKKFGADFVASHLLIYVVGDTVYLAAFVGGCFRGIAGIPLVFFLANAPDVL